MYRSQQLSILFKNLGVKVNLVGFEDGNNIDEANAFSKYGKHT